MYSVGFPRANRGPGVPRPSRSGPGAIYILDRGYVDFARLRRLVEGSAHFVVRAKKNLKFVRLDYRRVDKTTGLRSDQTIRLADPKTSLRYPESLRLIHYFDSETENRIVLLTDRFTLPALTVARLYKCRWQVELFFKWIKQHLKIKAFYGTSMNAVQTQIWIAISVYLLLAIARKELRIGRSLSEIQQILKVTIFQKDPVLQTLFTRPDLKSGDQRYKTVVIPRDLTGQ